MKAKSVVISTLLVSAFTIAIAYAVPPCPDPNLSGNELVGCNLYFDTTLSNAAFVPPGQSCSDCHLPSAGFVDPDKGKPVSEGVIAGMFGGRNSPSSAYAMYSPFFDYVEWIGGQFWDGRATGESLGDPLADQAVGPFLNPVEMANTKQGVIDAIKASDYKDLFEQQCDEDLDDSYNLDETYNCVGEMIAVFERTSLFAQFSSKYDAYLKNCITLGGSEVNCAIGSGLNAEQAGKIFSKKEWRGFQLFMGPNDNDGILEAGEGAFCVACHVADWTEATDYNGMNVIVPNWTGGKIPPLFTDFTYDNLGVPKSSDKTIASNALDPGLGTGEQWGTGGNIEAYGLFKVMTLRNIGLTSPYAHNGLFKSLEEITHFYNTRDVAGSLKKGESWAPPEVSGYPLGCNCDPSVMDTNAPEYCDDGDSSHCDYYTVNHGELGNLGLSDDDEDAIVKFMGTLSDGWTP